MGVLREFTPQQSRMYQSLERSQKQLASLGWSEMSCAPKDGTVVVVELQDGDVAEAHWASDLSGEEQPPYNGWFCKNANGTGYRQVFLVHWRPLNDEARQDASIVG